ncbi:MAG TPA: hypothetical protein VHE35_29685 [Kofleriaceae bacterium]|nr:hypothetical protein [Kofleriaceae bacterium]
MRFAALATSLAGLALLASACTDDRPTPKLPPELQVTSPSRGTMQEGLTTVQVTGTVAPNPETEVAIAKVEVNGVTAAVDVDGSFTAQVPLHAGANLIKTVATATDGGVETDTRAVVTGDMQPLHSAVENALSAGLSKEAFTKLGAVAGDKVAAADLSALMMPFNPVVAKGLSNGQEDCLYGKVSVKQGLDVRDANIQFTPNASGLAMDVSLDGVYAPLHARYAAACIDADTDITIRATQVRIKGQLAITVSAGRVHVALQNPDITLTGFDLDASGLPGAVLDLLDLDQEIGNIMASATEKMVGPMVEQAIEGVKVGEQHVTLLGKDLGITVSPVAVHFDTRGADIQLDTAMIVGSAPGSTSFVYTDNQVPPARTNAGLELAVADDAINQVLAGFWGAGAMDQTISKDLGLADGVSIHATVPPVVSTGSDGALHLTAGDLIATLTSHGTPITTLALNVEVALSAEPAAFDPTVVKLSLGLPTITTDVIDDSTGLDRDSLAHLMPAMVQLQLDGFAPILGAIPLPAIEGIRPVGVQVGGHDGYLAVSAGLE